MPTIPRILATTALCLAAMGLSSCYSTLHQYAWQRAKVIDEAYWVQDEENIELYRVGDTVYAKGFVGQARGDYSNAWKGNMLYMRGGGYSHYTPVTNSGKPIYIQISQSFSELRADLQQNRRENPERHQDNAVSVSWRYPGSSPYLSSLPAGAVHLTERGNGAHYIEGYGYESQSHTDAHKYYAYPLGAIMAVAVDAPLTIAGNALLVGGAVVALPFSAIYELYDYCTQNAPETVATPESTPQPQNSPST